MFFARDRFINVQLLRMYFKYEGKGALIRLKKDGRGTFVGEIVPGFLNAKGYRLVYFRGTIFRAHRLIYSLVHGAVPKSDIDHIDGNRSNNCVDNLRLVDRSTNNINRDQDAATVSGKVGVWLNPKNGKYVAYVTKNYFRYKKSPFDNVADALAWRRATMKKLKIEVPRSGK